MVISYTCHGGANVAVVQAPTICGDRFVHLSQSGPTSWVIRDYVTGHELRRTLAPTSASTSQNDLADIEAAITWAEVPPYHAVTHHEDWKAYLLLRSLAVLGKVDATPANSAFGNWQPIS